VAIDFIVSTKGDVAAASRTARVAAACRHLSYCS